MNPRGLSQIEILDIQKFITHKNVEHGKVGVVSAVPSGKSNDYYKRLCITLPDERVKWFTTQEYEGKPNDNFKDDIYRFIQGQY